MDVDTLYNCARDEFGLPYYKDVNMRQFVAECYFNDFNLSDYFDSPAVKCSFQEIEDVREAVSANVTWEQSGEKVLVLPSV